MNQPPRVIRCKCGHTGPEHRPAGPCQECRGCPRWQAVLEAPCDHQTLRLIEGAVQCADCGVRIDDEMSPVPGDPRADLKVVHQIDQAHASAEARIDGLVERFRAWRRENPDAPTSDAVQNPMAFYAIVQLGQTRIDMNDLPYLLAAAIMRIAKWELGQ